MSLNFSFSHNNDDNNDDDAPAAAVAAAGVAVVHDTDPTGTAVAKAVRAAAQAVVILQGPLPSELVYAASQQVVMLNPLVKLADVVRLLENPRSKQSTAVGVAVFFFFFFFFLLLMIFFDSSLPRCATPVRLRTRRTRRCVTRHLLPSWPPFSTSSKATSRQPKR